MVGKEILVNAIKGTVERRKKKSIRGVLDKNDLAESYNCNTKRGKQRPQSTEDTSLVSEQSVNAVEFKEEVVEELLKSESISHPLRKTSHHSFIQAIRTASEVNICEKLQMINNNSSLRHITNLDKVTEGSNRLTVAGYEPENSLRRMSSAVRPTQLRSADGLRRRSALDRPVPSHEQKNGSVVNLSNKELPEYEPENSLHRARKASDQTKPSQGHVRQRRNAVVLDNPTHSFIAFKSAENEKTQTAEQEIPSVQKLTITIPSSNTSPISPSSPGTPKTPRSHRRLFAPSIPENGEVNSSKSRTSSPQQTRKISANLKLPNLSTNNVSSQSSGLSLNRSHSSMFPIASSTTAITSSTTATLRPNRSSLSSLVISSPKLARRPARSSVSSLSQASADISEPKTSNKQPSRKKRLLTDGTHTNAARYWGWYVCNASYSWKNFNTDKIYCY